MAQNNSQTPDKSLVVAPPRLPYHPAVEERFGIDKSSWKALVEAIYPGAQSIDSVILALAYCKARGLDIMKRPIEIVPMWDSNRRCWVETVWPGITSHRITASRTGEYAGHDPTKFGPDCTLEWPDGDATVAVTFPEWAQMTVYRFVQGQRVPFPGPQVHWLEAVRKKKNGCPNSMWQTRPYGQLDKCAEAAALRSAFSEELGEGYIAEEMAGGEWHGRPAVWGNAKKEGKLRSDALADRLSGKNEPGETPDKSEPDSAGEAANAEALDAERMAELEAAGTEAEVNAVEKLILEDIKAGRLPAESKPNLIGRCAAKRTKIRNGRKSKQTQQSFVDPGEPASATEEGT